MSTFRVPYTDIKSIRPHPNADRLEIAKVYDWDVIVQKELYSIGDWVVYVPVDSLLPQELENELFSPDSKIKLRDHRIRSIKIRGHISQGMIINPNDLNDLHQHDILSSGAEEDLSKILGITKYEQPFSSLPKGMNVKTSKKITNPNFHKYSDIENYKWYDRLFQEGEEVYISEKLHGTAFRAGWFKNEPNTLWKKFLKLIRRLPEYEFCWGSRNVQIQGKLYHKGYYDTDVYSKTVKQYNLKTILPYGWAIYGEIVGHGIQKHYSYGCQEGEHVMYVYDVMYNGIYGNYEAMKGFCTHVGLPVVPTLYVGPLGRTTVEEYRDGDSLIGGQKVREGIVIKSVLETKCSIGRKLLKCISEGYYLLQDTSDHH